MRPALATRYLVGEREREGRRKRQGQRKGGREGEKERENITAALSSMS